MSNIQKSVWAIAATVIVYLVVAAPPPLGDEAMQSRIPIREVFEILQQENAKVREIYTREIVSEGKKQGYQFDEKWQDESIHAGPLPAQYLRETARYLEQSQIHLGLFLLSDYAINTANNVDGTHRALLQRVRQTRESQLMQIPDTGQFAYMAPDIAGVDACVDCHNKHPESPKTDWRRDDVMGAVTWIYQSEFVSVDEVIQMIAVLRQGFVAAYQHVLTELSQIQDAPEIGDRWPREGRYLPSKEVFLQEIEQQVSWVSMRMIKRLVSAQTETIAARGSVP